MSLGWLGIGRGCMHAWMLLKEWRRNMLREGDMFYESMETFMRLWGIDVTGPASLIAPSCPPLTAPSV